MDPPALLLHGFGQTRQSWGRTAAELGTQGWRAYAIDQRGHGDSERPVIAAYQYADFSADVLAIYEALKAPPLVIGASMGGIVALVAQGTFDAQLYRGLLLVDITPDVDMDGARRILSFMSTNPNGYANLHEAIEAIAAYRGPGRGKPSADGLTRVLRQGTDGRWRWHWDPRLLEARRAWLADPEAAEAHRAKMRTGMTNWVHIGCFMKSHGRTCGLSRSSSWVLPLKRTIKSFRFTRQRILPETMEVISRSIAFSITSVGQPTRAAREQPASHHTPSDYG